MNLLYGSYQLSGYSSYSRISSKMNGFQRSSKIKNIFINHNFFSDKKDQLIYLFTIYKSDPDEKFHKKTKKCN